MSKFYKFDLTPQVKGFVEWQLEHYREDKRELEEYKRDAIPSATPGYSLSGGCSGSTSRTTEDVAIRIETNVYVEQLERSCGAIERALSHFDATDMKLIDLAYWKRSHTIIGAGMAIGMSQATAYRHVNAILVLIAKEMGLVSLE